jgi:hypothetical protein
MSLSSLLVIVTIFLLNFTVAIYSFQRYTNLSTIDCLQVHTRNIFQELKATAASSTARVATVESACSHTSTAPCRTRRGQRHHPRHEWQPRNPQGSSGLVTRQLPLLSILQRLPANQGYSWSEWQPSDLALDSMYRCSNNKAAMQATVKPCVLDIIKASSMARLATVESALLR